MYGRKLATTAVYMRYGLWWDRAEPIKVSIDLMADHGCGFPLPEVPSSCPLKLSDSICETGLAIATERPANCSLPRAEAEVATTVARGVPLRIGLTRLVAAAAMPLLLLSPGCGFRLSFRARGGVEGARGDERPATGGPAPVPPPRDSFSI